jgi:hypothetical protein
MVPSLDTLCTLRGLVTTGQYAYVRCKYTLLYAIKKLFISNKKLGLLTYWFVPVWNMVLQNNKCLETQIYIKWLEVTGMESEMENVT